ncbi:MAG TPA: hypothetical protein HA236_01995 [Candidatus Nitrosotenuis sp.]|jgi:hypothetical protein|nr:hypothetical protein [Candidatus Nitrosotenuis sp.]
MEKKPTHVLAITLAAIMFATGVLYLSVASDEFGSLKQEAHAAESGENEATESGENERASSQSQSESGFGDMGEIVFFTIVGAAYIPIGMWMLKAKAITRKPYLIALIGSAALIVFYVATRTIDIPMVGLQEDVGAPDITAKVLQGAIVALAGFMLFAISKQRKTQKLA